MDEDNIKAFLKKSEFMVRRTLSLRTGTLSISCRYPETVSYPKITAAVGY
jgi:hypothetical protein